VLLSPDAAAYFADKQSDGALIFRRVDANCGRRRTSPKNLRAQPVFSRLRPLTEP